MRTHINSMFFEPPLGIPRCRRRYPNHHSYSTNTGNSARCVTSTKYFQACQAFSSSYFVRRNIKLHKLKKWAKDLPGFRCGKEAPFSRSMDAMISLFPRMEGAMFMKCSVLFAAVCWLCLLVWFGQKKAKSFVESSVFPSVSSVLSECLKREVELGVVRRITPLSITIDLCAVGPHSEEFSCLEIPEIKLRLRPFASLRAGKIVTDAILSRPNLLVVQKRDYTWLGIPSMKKPKRKHVSTEEGIDYRTKSRREAREKAAAQRAQETDVAARLAAEMGYIVSKEDSCFDFVEGMTTENNQSNYIHSSSDSGKEYVTDQQFLGERDGVKHTESEKPFRDKINNFGLNFWYGKVPLFYRHILKGNKSSMNKSDATIASKTKMLEHSAAKAVLYFRGRSSEESSWRTRRDTSPNANTKQTNDYGCGSSGYYGMEMKSECADNEIINEGRNSERFHFIRKDDSGKHTGFSTCDTYNSFNETQEMLEQRNRSEKYTTENHVHDLQEQPDLLNINISTEMTPGSSEAQGMQPSQSFPINKRVPPFLDSTSVNPESTIAVPHSIIDRICTYVAPCFRITCESPPGIMFGSSKKEKSTNVDDNNGHMINDPPGFSSDIGYRMLPVVVDCVLFRDGTLTLLAYGDLETREMGNVTGHIKFRNHYGHMNVHLSGNCKTWKSDELTRDGGWLSTDVFIDIDEQKWDVNLKLENIFVPLFERLLEIPITWSTGRTSGEINICMSKGEDFPNLYGQLDVASLAFQTYDAPAQFTDISASLFFRGQHIFLHSANGWFGNVPLDVSGDFGIHPEGQFHLMCHVSCVEVNALMKTFRIDLPLFPLAGSLTSVFNCQGPVDAPIFVGTAMASQKLVSSMASVPRSPAYDALMRNIDAGAAAALDIVPFSSLSANFTFNADDCVGDFFGIRALLVDGGEIRGAGSAWICPEGEIDQKALDLNVSGNLSFMGLLSQYLPRCPEFLRLQFEELNAEIQVSGSLLHPKFDMKWAAPKAEGSLSAVCGEIIVVKDYITLNSSSVAFELSAKVLTSYLDMPWSKRREHSSDFVMPIAIDGIELDLRMRGFEFMNLVFPDPFNSRSTTSLKLNGRIRFQAKLLKSFSSAESTFDFAERMHDVIKRDDRDMNNLVGDVCISGLRLNQLTFPPYLSGTVSISSSLFKMDAIGRPDESLFLVIDGMFQYGRTHNLNSRKMFSFALQKGPLKISGFYEHQHSAMIEIRDLTLDELELGSLRGTVKKAEVHLNLQKKRGHGMLSILHPRFSGVMGKHLDLAARWSGNVITIEKIVLQQNTSRYELQGEYVTPGFRDKIFSDALHIGFLSGEVAKRFSNMISSLGRWRVRLDVPRAEISEMLPLARFICSSTDPAVLSRSRDVFMQSLPSMGMYTENLRHLLEVTRKHSTTEQNDVVLEDISLPGLAELKGFWHGCLEAKGGCDGDTQAEFDFHGEDWEWGTYKAQHVQALGAYNSDGGFHLEKVFVQKDNATIHADGTLLGPKTNLHFAVLNFPLNLVPTVVQQLIERANVDILHSMRKLLAPIKGILHMEGDLRGNLARPECDVHVRLLDGIVGGIILGRTEIVISLTPTRRFLFNARIEPIVQNGHVHIQGSVPVTVLPSSASEREDKDMDGGCPGWVQDWDEEWGGGESAGVGFGGRKVQRDRTEDGWGIQLSEGLKRLKWSLLNGNEIRIDVDVKDGGMMLLTALTPFSNWLHGNADIVFEVSGTVDNPVINGTASFRRATLSSPVLRKSLTNFGGTIHMKANKLFINSLESRIGRRGKLYVNGSLALLATERSLDDKIEVTCDVLDVEAKHTLSCQVDSKIKITGSILEPNITGNIKLSHGEAYLPHDNSKRAASFNRFSRIFSSETALLTSVFTKTSGKNVEVGEESDLLQVPDIHLSNMNLILGPGLRIVYPFILNFGVCGEIELNGLAHPKWLRPKGVITFENGDVNLVATQVRLKRDHLNTARFDEENGLDPVLDIALVGSEWQFKIQSRASNWQDKLVVMLTRSVEQEALSLTEAARVFESELADSILEGDGQLALRKLATASLERLMPRIEGKGEFGQARWRVVYVPQIPTLLTCVDPLKSLTFGTEVEVEVGKRIQASIAQQQMKDAETALHWTLIYHLTARFRLLLHSAPFKRLLFEYSTSSRD